ncbi:MAG: hypothetical protein K0R84_633 [Clostridia bacterium]|jgi:putative tricarboxylic transport membrane protein|nr:hypothetical protein [Clostridia bacterium]
MKKVGINSVVGFLFIALSLLWMTQIVKLPKAMAFAGFGAGFFPQLVVILMMIVSVLLIVTDLRDKNKSTTFVIAKENILKLILIVLLAAAYIFILPIAGYVISTIAAVFLLLLLFGLRKKVTIVLTSVLFPLAIYYLFEVALKVLLP